MSDNEDDYGAELDAIVQDTEKTITEEKKQEVIKEDKPKPKPKRFL